MADITHYNNALYATFSPFLLRCCLLWFIRVVESAVSQVAICSRQVAASVCVHLADLTAREVRGGV